MWPGLSSGMVASKLESLNSVSVNKAEGVSPSLIEPQKSSTFCYNLQACLVSREGDKNPFHGKIFKGAVLIFL